MSIHKSFALNTTITHALLLQTVKQEISRGIGYCNLTQKNKTEGRKSS